MKRYFSFAILLALMLSIFSLGYAQVDPVDTFPFVEDFETGQTHNTQVQGWTQILDNGKTKYWTANSTFDNYNRAPRNGSFNAFLEYNSNAWMMRSFILEGGVSYDVEVWARQDRTSGATLAMYYGDDSTIAGDAVVGSLAGVGHPILVVASSQMLRPFLHRLAICLFLFKTFRKGIGVDSGIKAFTVDGHSPATICMVDGEGGRMGSSSGRSILDVEGCRFIRAQAQRESRSIGHTEEAISRGADTCEVKSPDSGIGDGEGLAGCAID